MTEWTDRVYLGPAPTLTVEGVSGGRVELTSSGLPDAVVWNPWKEKVGYIKLNKTVFSFLKFVILRFLNVVKIVNDINVRTGGTSIFPL